jgi:hypothetical protein
VVGQLLDHFLSGLLGTDIHGRLTNQWNGQMVLATGPLGHDPPSRHLPLQRVLNQLAMVVKKMIDPNMGCVYKFWKTWWDNHHFHWFDPHF